MSLSRKNSSRIWIDRRQAETLQDPSEFDEFVTRVLPARKPEFQRLQHVLPLSFRRSVVTVVEQYDVAGFDFTNPVDHQCRRLRVPIPSVHRPRHHLRQSKLDGRRMKLWSTKSEW